MKKNLRFLLALAIGWLTSTGAFALEQVDGVYQIGTADELIEFAGIVNGGENGAKAVLTADIDMTEKTWTPIGDNDHRYVGTFDGQYHMIDNLVYEGGEKAGIFGVVNGGCVIKNLIAGPGNVIKGTAMIGGIIGASDGSGWVELENVGHEGYVEGTGNNCCAIFGVIMNGGPATRITNCYNTGNVKAGGESAIITGWFGGHGSVEVKGFWNTGKMLSGGENDGKNLWRNNTGITTERIFNLFDAQGATVIGDGDLASGKLAYMLNGNADAGVWRQNLEGDSKDAYPTFIPTHAMVYANGALLCDGLTPKEGSSLTFSNTEGSTVDEHVFADGVCDVCLTLAEPVQGVYLLGNAKAMLAFSNALNSGAIPANSNATLTADIDMSSIEWVPIGVDGKNFAGTFDGAQHRIMNMTIDGTKKEQGLFSTCQGGAVIKNLIIDSSCKMVGTGGANVAALIGCVNHNNFDNTTILIENVGNEMSFSVNSTNNAGFVARDFSSFLTVNIKNCYNTGDILGGVENGAFTAWTPRVILTNCWNTGRIEATGGYDGSTSLARGNQPILVNSYDLNSENTDNAGAPEGYTTEWLASGQFAYLLNGNSSENVAWYQVLGADGDAHPMPFGTAVVYANGTLDCAGNAKEGTEVTYSNTEGSTRDEHVFVDGFCSACGQVDVNFMAETEGAYNLAAAKDVVWFAALVNSGKTDANARLTADIDFKDVTFTGIGNGSNPYAGTFDGQRHIVKNLTIDLPEEANVGFFRDITNGAVIQNFTIDATCSVTGKNYAGAFVGHASGNGSARFEQLGNEGNVTTLNQNAGAILGCNTSGELKLTVLNCYNAGIITSSNEAGGLSGWFGNDAVTTNCYNMGTVVNGESFARGNNIQITNCFDPVTDWPALPVSPIEDFTNGKVFIALAQAAPGVWYLSAEEGGHPVLYQTEWDGKVTFAATFTTNYNWEKVFAYTFSKNDADEVIAEQLGAWPGTELTATEGVYSVNISAYVAPQFIIFSNGAGMQTADLAFEEGKAYVHNIPVVEFASAYNGNEVTDGDFFIYNVASGLWLQNNEKNTGDWNTRGATGTYGFAFGIKAIDGGWQLDPKFGHNHSMNASNFYLDTNDGLTTWMLMPVVTEDGKKAYYINAGENRLSLNDDNNLDWNTGKGDIWQLVTREDRINYLTETATEENPLDASFLIDDPSFANENERAASWKWEKDGGNTDDVRWYRNRRSYAIWNSNSFKISQTISNVPNGKYALTFKGYYRDGDRDQVAERRAAGEERLIAKYFINNDKADVMSILDGANENWIEGLFFYPAADAEAPYGHYPDNADGFNRIFQDYPDAYQNKQFESVVTTGTITLGLEKLEANSKDWLAFDDFRLIYLGNTIDLSEFITGLENALEVAKGFDASTTSNVLAQELAQAITDGENALTSTDVDVISAAASAITAAYEAAKAVNMTVLRQTLTLANTEMANEFDNLVDAIESIRAASEVDFYTFELRTARKINALSVKDVFTGSAPEADKEYFLYNIGTGMWLNNGSDWNTHAAVDVYALPITLVAAEDGKFKMKNHAFYRDEQWINWNAYVDTGNQDTWTFNPVEGKENVYTINSEGNRTDVGRLLGYDPYGPTDRGDYWYWSNVTKDRFGVDDPNNQWKLVSRDEIDALYANASKENPADVSYLIANPGLSRVWDINKWTKVCDGGNNGAHITSGDDGNFDRNSDYGYEVWNANSFSFTQELNGLKPGIYEVSVNGFFRQGDGGFQADVVNNSGELISEAYLVANNEKALLPNIATEAGKMPGIFSQNSANGTFANWPKEALAAFETGLYGASVQVVVENDGKLTIGVKQDEKTTDSSWVLFDSFRLKYLGETPITAMSILGDFTGGWEFAEEQDMTQDEENPAIWTLAIEDFEVEFEEGQTERVYDFKATANHQWGRYELPALGQGNERGNQDWKFAEGSDYPAGVYDLVFTVDTENHTLTLVPTFDAVATGISEVNAVDGQKNVYNLQGQKVQQTKKGLYIKNGHKVVIK